MKIKALLIVCASLLLSGCVTTMVVGSMVELGAKQLVGSPPKEWTLTGENNARGDMPLLLVWSEEPLTNLNEKQVKEASIWVHQEYKGGDFPNRYLNVFTVEQLITYGPTESKGDEISPKAMTDDSNSPNNRKHIVIRRAPRIINTKFNHAAFDVNHLMLNKTIMYGSLAVRYDKESNVATLIYKQADLTNRNVNANTGEVYYSAKSPVVLDSKELLKLN